MESEIYLRKNTFIHKLHPSTKILVLIMLFTLFTTFNHPLAQLTFIIITFMLILISKSTSNIWRFKYLLIILSIASVFLWSLIIKEGEAYYEILSMRIYRNSFLYGLSMAMRLSSIIMLGIIFISSTTTEEFTYGLRKLKLPYPLAFAISLAFRMVPNIFQTTHTVSNAQMSRGYHPEGGGIISRIKRYIPLMVPVLLYTIRNANQIAIALESKGFRRPERTDFIKREFVIKDTLIIIFTLSIVIASIILRVKGYGKIIDRI